MKNQITYRVCLLIICSLLFAPKVLYSQAVKFKKENLEANDVTMSIERLRGKKVLRVIKDSRVVKVDEPTFVRIKTLNFRNGTIEVKVLSRLLKNAPDFARGFIGIAFRINDDNSEYESIYIRPTNGRADDQIRRNHSVQYYSYPDYKFDRLRKESPERYESYADMALNEWIQMKIVVNGNQAKLFLNKATQPALIVNDLKHGAGASGAIGLWVEVGTEGFFSDVRVTPSP